MEIVHLGVELPGRAHRALDHLAPPTSQGLNDALFLQKAGTAGNVLGAWHLECHAPDIQ